MNYTNSNLFSKVRYYHKLSQELQAHLSKYPDDWPRFQNIFNSTLEKISMDILRFEKNNITKSESKIYKFKITHIHSGFEMKEGYICLSLKQI